MMAVRDAARAGVGRLRLPSDSTVSGRRRTAIVSALTMERCADRDPEPRVPSRRPPEEELLLTTPDELVLATEKSCRRAPQLAIFPSCNNRVGAFKRGGSVDHIAGGDRPVRDYDITEGAVYEARESARMHFHPGSVE